MGQWVLLKHELSDGAWHYDWMFERERPDGPLITFRTLCRPDDGAISRFEAQRLNDHRRDYLTCEGPISGNRGTVSRVQSGLCRLELETRTTLVICLLDTNRLLSGQARADGVTFDFLVEPRKR